MGIGWLGGGDGGEYNEVGFVSISKIFATESTLFCGTEPVERVSKPYAISSFVI